MKRHILVLMMLIFTTSCDAQSFSIPKIQPQKDRSPQTVEYRDHMHLDLLAGLVQGNAQKTGMVPENICDEKGKPLLSWRVAILQYGSDAEVALYKKFKLDEPWDSKHNKDVAEEVPEIYVDPAGTNYTPYLGVSGKTAAFAGKPRPIDGTRNGNAIASTGKLHAAIVVVDTSKVKVFWTEPKDVPLEKIEKNVRWYMKQTRYLHSTGTADVWEKGKPGPVFEFE